ncbi:MAG: PP2C family protein-serine/threonine phosphatase, partial [Cyclobacteriaceae bacterium]
YDFIQEKLTYVNAGHNPLVLCREGLNATEILEAGTTILGAFEQLPFLEHGERKDLKNFTIHLYTDGLTETTNREEEEFGEARFLNYISNNLCPSPDHFHEQFFQSLENFSAGMPKKDDITLLSLKFN